MGITRDFTARRAGARGFAALGVGFALLLAGCAGLDTPRTPEEAVRERAQGWADALLAGDLEGAYRYTSPNYRQFASASAYHARVAGTGRWESAEVSEVTCAGDACEVTFVLEYPAGPTKVDLRRPRTYKWVRTEGEWWLYVAP